jgi:VCBS repeat-containing protein
MRQWWNKSNRRTGRGTSARRPKRWRSNLAVVTLEDRTVPSTFTATNSTSIAIPANQSTGVGAASPSPSTISVSGLTGVVTHLSVTFNNLSHDSLNDIDALLVAPDGTNMYLMSDNGGPNTYAGLNLTFDSNAPASATLPDSGVVSGTYAPFNEDSGGGATDDTITGLPSGTPAPVTSMGLGGFSGINPNGTWGLYINDDTAFGVGQMAGGWTLTFDYRPNSPPVANADTYNTNENTALNVTAVAGGVLANDTDADGDPRTAHLVTAPANGTVTLNGNGTFTYTPNHYFYGADMFTYRDDDGVVYGNTATVTVNVAHINQPPTAVNDTYTLQNGGVQVVPSWRGVLANDVDPDGAIPNSVYYAMDFQNVTLQQFPLDNPSATPPEHGIHGGTNVSNGSADWAPNLPTGWVRDNLSTPPPTTHTVGTPPNQTTYLDTGGQVYYGWHVLDIDSWIAEQGDQQRSYFQNEVNYPGYGPPTIGSHNHILVADGDAYDDYESLGGTHMSTYAYLPPVPLIGGVDGTLKLEFDSSFRPEDPSDGLQQGTVDVSFDGGTTWTNLLTMDNTDPNNPSGPPLPAGDLSRDNQHITLPINNAPGATALFRFGYLDASNEWWWAVDNIKVTAQRTDASTLTATVVSPPSHGSLSLASDGSFTYTPAAGYTGPDSFTYHTSDGQITTSPATVSITVNANNTAPVAVNDSYSMIHDQTLTVPGPSGTMVNDSDPDTGGFDGLTTSLVAGPAHGTLTFHNDGSFVYTPNAGFGGTDSFTYKLSDPVHQSNTATVTISVKPPPPIANNDIYSVNNNGVLTTTAATGVLANDFNNNLPFNALLDSGPVGYTQATAHGTLTFNTDGSFTYVPHPFYYGPDSFTYIAFDPNFQQASNVATVNITVNQVNVAPVTKPDAFTTPVNTALTTTAAAGLLANDRDDGVTTTLLTENFDELPLTTFGTDIHHGATGNANGDWTDAVPTGWTRDNAPAGYSATPPPSNPSSSQEVYYGWHVFDADSWVHEQSDQDRSKFLNERKFPGFNQTAPIVGSHNHVLVADGDGYQDYVSISPTNPMNTMFISPTVPLAGLNQNSLTLEFDSSFRPEENQTALVDVSYDGGTTWNNLLTYTTDNTGGSGAEGFINNHLTLDANNPAGAANAVFRFGYVGAGNDWWWTIDNIKVTGQTPNTGSALTAAAASQPNHGTVTVNANGSFTYTPAAGFTGLDSFTYTASDGNGHTSAPQTATVLVGNASLGVQVNDGSAQRSEVRSITVGFKGTATFAGSPAAAFQLVGSGGGAAGVNVPLTATVVNADGNTNVILTFSAGAGNGTDPVSAMNGGVPSLADGRYQLTVLSSQVTINGQALDGDNNGTPGGDFVSPAETSYSATALRLYRQFGDADGTGVNDLSDLTAFRNTYNAATGNPSFVSYLDADNSGVVDLNDLTEFRNRYNHSIFGP